MTSTLDLAPRSDAGPSHLRVTATALRLVERLRVEAGDVALLVAPRLSGDVLCLGRRDVTLGPNDTLVDAVLGCPIYVDRRAYPVAALSTRVLDVQVDSFGPRFVLRSPTEHST